MIKKGRREERSWNIARFFIPSPMWSWQIQQIYTAIWMDGLLNTYVINKREVCLDFSN